MCAISHAHVVALSGGVGGAKLAHGLVKAFPADNLSVFLNTGDDFERLGVHTPHGIDTPLYALAIPPTGWGRRGEAPHFTRARSNRKGGRES